MSLKTQWKKRETTEYISVLGFGTGNYKDSKVEIMADNGNGNYYYIDNLREAKKGKDEDKFGTKTEFIQPVDLLRYIK